MKFEKNKRYDVFGYDVVLVGDPVPVQPWLRVSKGTSASSIDMSIDIDFLKNMDSAETRRLELLFRELGNYAKFGDPRRRFRRIISGSRRSKRMSYIFDSYRIANAFQYGAVNGHKEFCKNIAYNYSHVYRKSVRDVLADISVMFIDPEGFEYDEYRKIKIVIKELMEETKP